MKTTSPRTGKLVNPKDMSFEELTELCAWNTDTELDLLWQFLGTQAGCHLRLENTCVKSLSMRLLKAPEQICND
jgi:hypothetical protein